MPEPARDVIEAMGTVREQLENALYKVALENEGRGEVTAHVAGGSSLLRLRPGDAVVVELMPFDTGRARILRRRA
jgi:translation initiation factor IF-1